MFLQQITSRFGHAALKFLIFLLQGILSNKYNDYSSIHCKKVFIRLKYYEQIIIYLQRNSSEIKAQVYCDVQENLYFRCKLGEN